MVSYKNSALAVDVLIIVKIHAAVNHIAGEPLRNNHRGGPLCDPLDLGEERPPTPKRGSLLS